MRKHDIDNITILRRMLFEESDILKEYKIIRENIVNESYNLYSGIEEDVEFLTKCIIDTIATMKGSNGSKEYEYKLKNLKGVKKIIVNIENIELHKKSASISVEGNTMVIDIVIGMLTRWLNLNDMYEIMHYGIEKELIHELTHGKIEMEQNTGIAYNDGTQWYNVAYKYIAYHGRKENRYLYMFFYSLYASDYEEVQTYAAEATHEVGMKIEDCREWKTLRREEKIRLINNFLYNTEAYATYYTILHSFLPRIKEFSNETIDEIFRVFKEQRYNITEKEYNNFVKQIEFSSKRALSKMERGKNKYYEKYNLN